MLFLWCFNLFLHLSGPKKCPACREDWDTWPNTNIVLNQFLQKAFPGMNYQFFEVNSIDIIVRYKRGFREKEEERIQKRKELESVSSFCLV